MPSSPTKLVILGAAESGVGAALLGQRLGWDVFVSDAGEIKPHFKAQLETAGIAYESGAHTFPRITQADLIVKSPGIPEKAAVVQLIRQQGLTLISEIELAGRYCPGQIIAITGSNGKTTTTSLIHSMLTHAGIHAALVGNIGRSFAAQVAEDLALARPHAWYVVEVSSFQLDDIITFRPHIALLLNITPNHLDRYNYSLQAYAAAKFGITRNQQANDYFIYGLDSEALMAELPHHTLRARMLGFARERTAPGRPDAVAWAAGGELLIDYDPEPYELQPELISQQHLIPTPMNQPRKNKKAAILTISVEEQRLKGKHNEYNTMASAIVGRVLDIRNELVRESMLNFDSIEHRLERVRTTGGVEYINDSKATSVNAAWYALESMTQPTVWIVGGQDKGNDYGMLLPIVKEKVKAIVMMGKDVAKIQDAFKGQVPSLKHALTMEEAVRMAAAEAYSGDTVLLSPACASFDLFENYEARGHAFKSAVEGLV